VAFADLDCTAARCDFWWFGLYKGIWRYATMFDLRRIVFAVAAIALIIPLIFFMLRVAGVVPRSVLIIHPLLLLVAMGGARLLYRLWKERLLFGDYQLRGEPVIILGAGDAGLRCVKNYNVAMLGMWLVSWMMM